MECFAEMMLESGYTREQMMDSVDKEKFDDIYAHYHLLGERHPEVRSS